MIHSSNICLELQTVMDERQYQARSNPLKPDSLSAILDIQSWMSLS
jgi:hypothetical protein